MVGETMLRRNIVCYMRYAIHDIYIYSWWWACAEANSLELLMITMAQRLWAKSFFNLLRAEARNKVIDTIEVGAIELNLRQILSLTGCTRAGNGSAAEERKERGKERGEREIEVNSQCLFQAC